MSVIEKTAQYARALDANGEEVHISDVNTKGGLFSCIGCGKRMVSVQSDKDRIDYFKHYVKLKRREDCSFKPESHRHEIAKVILQEIKRIKVPPVYKEYQTAEGSKAIKIVSDQFIEAHSVKLELSFYRDLEGVVHWGKNPEIKERQDVFKPDVVFFNAAEQPILLIELFVTNAVDEEKEEKIRNVGIDTIQVKIPDVNDEEIKKGLLNTSQYTKWIYNQNYEKAEFIPVSEWGQTEVSGIDKHKAQLLGESFGCRKARIRNLIRDIEFCLESESYRAVEQHLQLEIKRVEGERSRIEQRLEYENQRARNTVEERIGSEFGSIAKEEMEIREAEERWQLYFRKEGNRVKESKGDLEKRYLGKKGELEVQQGNVDKKRNKVDRLTEQSSKKIEYSEQDFENETESFRTKFSERKQRVRKAFEDFRETIKFIRVQEELGFPKASEKYRVEEEEIDSNQFKVEEAARRERETIEDIGRKSKEIRNGEREYRTAIRANFQRLFDEFRRTGNITNNKRLQYIQRKFETTTSYRAAVHDFEKAIERATRYRKLI